MSFQNIKIFKLNYSGKIETRDSSDEDPLELFSHVNIIAVYVINQKRLYIWVGSNASRALKNYIVEFRQIFSNDYPELRVLRYFTVEGKSEPFDFFQSIGISEEDLYKRLKSEEDKLSPVKKEIDELKDEADKLFEAEEYEQSIEAAEKILALANQIEDNNLAQDQQDFIDEAHKRINSDLILSEIKSEKSVIWDLMSNLKELDDYIKLHNYVESFREKYSKFIDLTGIPDVNDLFIKENSFWREYQESQANKEKERSLQDQKASNFEDLKIKINELRIKGKAALEKGQIIESFEIFNTIVQILTRANK